MKRLALTFLMALSLGAGFMSAATQTAHSHGTGPRGGQIGHAELFHVEMVTDKSKLDIYIYDENMNPISLDQFEVSATIQAGNQRDKIDLAAAGANKMNGESALMVETGVKIILLLKPKGKPQVQVRFGH